MMKEDIVPTEADRRIFNLAPVVFLVPCLLIFATIPFAPGLGVADLNIGILFFLAVSSMEIVGLFMAGWSSNNKYALISAMRAVNQIISYDLPFLLAALVPVLLTGSLRLSDIAAAQRDLWFIAYPVLGQLGFLAFIVASVAAENRVPFDILEAESELVAGFRVEYSGMKFAMIQLGEYAHVIGTSFLGALLFLGAWAGPGPDWLGPSGSCSRRCRLPAHHLDSVELHPHPRRSDPADFLEAVVAPDDAAGDCDGDRHRAGGAAAVANARRGRPGRHRCAREAVYRAMRVSFINLFRKPVTVHYPTAARRIPDRFRGLLALTYHPDTGEENCIGCRLCEFVCPPRSSRSRC